MAPGPLLRCVYSVLLRFATTEPSLPEFSEPAFGEGLAPLECICQLYDFADNGKTSTCETVTDAEPLHNPVLTLNIGWTIPERTEGIAIHSISEELDDHNPPSTSCSSWIQVFL